MTPVIALLEVLYYGLVHFEIPVDVFDKHEGGEEWSCAYHEEEDVAGENSVAKKFDRLEGTVHVWTLVVVKHGIAKHKETSRAVESKEEEGGREREGGGERERERAKWGVRERIWKISWIT